MTVAAAASAAAPVEQSSAPIEQVEAPPSPLSETPPAAAKVEPEAPKAPLSTREALRAAAAKVEAGESAKAAGDGNDPAKDPAKGTDLVRGEGGKFVPKDAAAAKPADKAAPAAAVKTADAAPKPGEQPVAAAKPAVDPNAPKHAAPERFSPDAKAAWDTAPEPVKAEVSRMHREMTQGIEKHRAAAEKFETVREFDELASKSGTDLKTALTRYVNMEQALRQNPLKGLEAVCQNIGVSLRDVAQIVLGQKPEEQQSQADATIRELRQTVTRLEQQVGGVTQHFQRQAETSLQDQIARWADSRPHFEIIAPHIAAEMRDGATSLDDAEERVLQKYPQLATIAKASTSPKPEEQKPAASAAAAPDLEAQTLRGQKSIKGAPGSGSEPAAQPRSSSIKEALKRAAAKAG
jgi:uncharacterized protein YukE